MTIFFGCFQFLGIPPKGERSFVPPFIGIKERFQFLGIPPKGEHAPRWNGTYRNLETFPISRDPPEGGTEFATVLVDNLLYLFPISRDPPEGGTR